MGSGHGSDNSCTEQSFTRFGCVTQVSLEGREVHCENKGRYMQRPEVGDCPVHAGACRGPGLCFESCGQQSPGRDAVGM